MSSLLLVERYVLENVTTAGVTINDVVAKTELNSSIVQAALYHLKSEGVVHYQSGKYSLNPDLNAKWRKELNDEKSKRLELMDLFSQMLNYYYKSKRQGVELRLERARLDEFEYKLLQSHLKSLNDFFKNLKSRKKQPSHSQDYVFLYANSLFPSLVKASVF